MIMVAKTKKNKQEKGQALIEFILIIPLLIAFLWYLIQINMAINASVVGQQFARAQLFVKLHNHRDGPTAATILQSPERAVYFIAVSADIVKEAIESGVVPPQPAPLYTLGVGASTDAVKAFPGARDDRGEAQNDWLRQNIRVRTAFGICTSPARTKADGTRTSMCGD